MQRRRLLTLGLGAASVLALAGGGMALLRPGYARGRLAPEAAAVIDAIARAVLDGSLSPPPAERDAAFLAHLTRMDTTIAAFPAATQAELSRLLALLASPLGRTLLAGLQTPWEAASIADIQQCMQSMRLSSLKLRQQVYHALRDLTNAAFYADSAAWRLMGYPGPVPA